MKKIMNLPLITSILFVSCFSMTSDICAVSDLSRQLSETLVEMEYHKSWTTHSDISEHLPHIRRLAKECNSVIALGLSNPASSWGIFKGLSESPYSERSYVGIDKQKPHEKIYKEAQAIVEANGISFNILHANELEIDIETADMLFVDSIHTYCHLMYELEKFSPKIRKYIAMHDTSDPFTYQDDVSYRGDYSEYPAYIDRSKRGTWPAVRDFLIRHPEWKLQERHLNSFGFTILKRVSN